MPKTYRGILVSSDFSSNIQILYSILYNYIRLPNLKIKLFQYEVNSVFLKRAVTCLTFSTALC